MVLKTPCGAIWFMINGPFVFRKRLNEVILFIEPESTGCT